MSPAAAAALGRDLSRIPVPERSRALLAGEGEGLGALEALSVRLLSREAARLAGLLLAREEREAAYAVPSLRLSGLGPGLTPSGDDLLLGLLAMARRLEAERLVAPGAVRAFERALVALPPAATTAVAAEMRRQALEGHFPAPLSRLVDSLGTSPGTGTLRLEASRLAATGAHSGADMLAGALTLARAAAQEREA